MPLYPSVPFIFRLRPDVVRLAELERRREVGLAVFREVEERPLAVKFQRNERLLVIVAIGRGEDGAVFVHRLAPVGYGTFFRKAHGIDKPLHILPVDECAHGKRRDVRIETSIRPIVIPFAFRVALDRLGVGERTVEVAYLDREFQRGDAEEVGVWHERAALACDIGIEHFE